MFQETLFATDSAIDRRLFLRRVGNTAVLMTASGAILSTANCGGNLAQALRFANLDEALKAVDGLAEKGKIDTHGPWNVPQILIHLAQSIEYSMTGYPENKSVIIRKTIGRLVLSRFLSQGYMTHNLSDPIPGAPALDANASLQEGIARLKKAVADFRSFQDELKIHFVYDKVTRDEYERVQAMHVANHLSAFTYG
ncbi:MAG: DUF1569 domain-containing protein [Leptospirales bacterium]|nr:DUF1569 domain-containing protein [Leptospirales bacterium]